MDTNDKDRIPSIMCPKCGFEMKVNDRFCVHCGYINYENTQNEYLKKYNKKSIFSFLKRKNKYIDIETKEKKKKVHEVNGWFFTIINKFAKWIVLAVFLIILSIVIGRIKSYQIKVVEDANVIVSIIKNKYNDNFSSCNEINGAYYIVFDTKSIERMGNVKLNHDYNGYVKIVKTDNKYEYYINMKIDQFGIKEKNIEKVSSWDVLPYFGVELDTITDSDCR